MRRRKKTCKKGYRRVTVSFRTKDGEKVRFTVCKRRPTRRVRGGRVR